MSVKLFSAKLIEMCELAGKSKKHSMLLKQKSMIIIAMTERESENKGSEEERQVPLKIQ